MISGTGMTIVTRWEGNKMFKDIFSVPLSYWLLIPAILQTTIPWFAFRVRIVYVFILMLCWLVFNFNSVFYILAASVSRSFRITLFWFIVYNFLNNLYAIFGFGDFSTYGEVSITMAQMIYFIIAHYLLVTNRYRELKFLTCWIFIGVIIAGLMGLRGFGVEGLEGARSLVGTGAKELTAERIDKIIQTATFGLGDYRYVYMCSWLFGILLMTCAMVKTVLLRLMLLMIAIACVISVRMGGLGTPVIIMIVEMIIFIIWYCLRKSRRVVKVLGYALVVGIAMYFVTPIVYRPFAIPLKYVAEHMEEGSVKTRISLLAESFWGDDNYTRERARLQLISWYTFCRYPILGEGMYHFEYGEVPKNEIGGHSLVLDRLAKSGIIGFLPFIIFIFWLGKYYEDISRVRFRKDWLAIPAMFTTVYIFSSIANPTFGIPNVIYIVLPGIAYMIAYSRKELQPPPMFLR